MSTVPKSEVEILNSSGHFTTVVDGSGQFVTESQGCTQTSDGDSRTGTFPKMQPTKGDTVCSVNGVL